MCRALQLMVVAAWAFPHPAERLCPRHTRLPAVGSRRKLRARRDAHSQHSATTTIWVDYRGFGSTSVTRSGDDERSQPACSCGDDGGKGGGELVENRSGAFDATLPVQTDCTGDGGSGGGGGSGGEGGMMRCYTVTTEHYWYHPDTGVYEYRYTETNTWCELIQ